MPSETDAFHEATHFAPAFLAGWPVKEVDASEPADGWSGRLVLGPEPVGSPPPGADVGEWATRERFRLDLLRSVIARAACLFAADDWFSEPYAADRAVAWVVCPRTMTARQWDQLAAAAYSGFAADPRFRAVIWSAKTTIQSSSVCTIPGSVLEDAAREHLTSKGFSVAT